MSYRVKTMGRQRFKILETRSDIGGYVRLAIYVVVMLS